MEYFRGILKRNELSERSPHETSAAPARHPPFITEPSRSSVHTVRCVLLVGLLVCVSACRALRLTADVIEQNSANYTAWAYRRSCLYALQRPLQEELSFAEDIGRASPKNYQLWHHRRALREKLGQLGNELAFTVHSLQHHGPHALRAPCSVACC